MGVSFKGGTTSYHGLGDNLSSTAKTYNYSNGYFGIAGTSNRVRVIYSDNPAKTGKDFYDKIAHGGIESNLPNGKGKKTELSDGTIITFRPTTKSDNNPGVDINISKSNDSGGIKKQKIHFEKEDDE